MDAATTTHVVTTREILAYEGGSFADAPQGDASRMIGGEELWLPMPSMAGVPVGIGTVSAFGAYYSGVYVISSDLSSVPFVVTKKSPGGVRQVDDSFWLHDCVYHSPDGEMSATGFFAAATWHLCTRGNSYSRILYDDSRMFRPVGFKPGDQDKWNVYRRMDKDRTLYYSYDGEPLLPKEVIHIANIGGDGVIGVSPITHSRESLGLAMATEKMAASWYGNGIHPGGAIEIPDKFDAEKLRKYRAAVENVHQGPYNAYKHLLLFGGWKFIPTTISAEDADFLASRQMSIEDIARILNLAPSKLQKWDKVSFSTLEEVNTNHYDSCIYPIVRRMTTEFNRKLLTPIERRSYEVTHDISQGRRGRILDEANRDKIWNGMGVISANEIRARHGMPPIPGGDTYFVPLNSAPMNKVAKASIQTLKGVKGVTETDPTDGIDVPTTETDQGGADDGADDGSDQTSAPEAVAAPSRSLDEPTVRGILGIVGRVASGKITREAGRAILGHAYPGITPDVADAMLASRDALPDPVPGPAPDPVPAPDPDVIEAAREIVADVSRRVTTRLVGGARRCLRKGDLSEILPALDALLDSESATLAAMFGPACRVFGAANRCVIDPARIAEHIVRTCRSDILHCVESDSTIANIELHVNEWASAFPGFGLKSMESIVAESREHRA